MTERLGLQTFIDFVQHHWVSAFFLGLTLATILTAFLVGRLLRRRLQRLLEERSDEEGELDALPPPGPMEQRSLEVLKQFRREIWNMPDVDLQLGVEPLTQFGFRIVRSIGAVYHPEAENPQYEATLVESLQLARRISAKLTRMATAAPFRYLGNRKISDCRRYYQAYRRINENPILRVLRNNPNLSRIARLAMNVKNLGNPLYWAGKELSREGYFFVLRWFYLTFANQVGREAMRLYSGRRFREQADRDAALVCYRLFALTGRWGGPSASEWAALTAFTANHSNLDSDTKLHILTRFAERKLPKDLDGLQLQTAAGAKWYREGLDVLLKSSGGGLPEKDALIRKEKNETA